MEATARPSKVSRLLYDAALLSREPLRRMLPVHEVLVTDGSLARIPYPFMVSRWIDGITLNECRKRVPPEEFLTQTAARSARE
jgi:hypothetical protein